MTNFWPLALPLLAAFTYVAAVILLKRSAELGAGLWPSTVVANLIAAVAFQGLLAWGGTWQPWSLWWQPLLVACLFLSGQIWTLVSLQRGDVSIATPILGLKVVLVALLTMLLLSGGLSWQLWLAAALSSAGIASLNHSKAHRAGTHPTATIVSAAIAAISFALFDVLVQKWSPAWGIGRFLPLTIGMVGLISLALVPLIWRQLRALSPAARRWLRGGSVLFALQSLLFVSSIAHFGQATAANVVYSSRGVWSVVAVALLGHWFHSAEKSLGGSILRWRFFGASLMLAAIVLVLV